MPTKSKIIDKKLLKGAIKKARNYNHLGKILGVSAFIVKLSLKYHNLNFVSYGLKEDLTGQRFCKLLIVKESKNKRDKRAIWLCKCDCGNKVEVRGLSLKSGMTKSCGCLAKINIVKAINSNIKFQNPKDRSACEVFKANYNDGNLTIEQFKILSQFNCFYCGEAPSNFYNAYSKDIRSNPLYILNGEYTYNGLDRINNKLPHNFSNVIPCCRHCNWSKSNLSLSDFQNHIINIYKIREIIYSNNFTNLIIPQNIELKNKSLYSPRKKRRIKQIVNGMKIGRITILEFKSKSNIKIRCDCGKVENYIYYHKLINNEKLSCGAGNCMGKFDPIISIARNVWIGRKNATSYKNDGISFAHFYELSQMNCYYCNLESTLSNKAKSRRANNDAIFTYNGLDRIDSNKKHFIGNVVASCIKCNMMKGNFSLDRFDNWINKVWFNFGSKQIKIPKYFDKNGLFILY